MLGVPRVGLHVKKRELDRRHVEDLHLSKRLRRGRANRTLATQVKVQENGRAGRLVAVQDGGVSSLLGGRAWFEFARRGSKGATLLDIIFIYKLHPEEFNANKLNANYTWGH